VKPLRHRGWFAGSAGSLACVLFAALGAISLAGCSTSPGRPVIGSETLAPNDVSDFSALYSENCAGCHGTEGRGGAAIALADPVYLGIVDDATIRKVTANGVHGTSMPAFAHSAGGLLTEKQVDLIASGIRTRWGKSGVLDGTNPPSYAPKSAGDVSRGALVYKNYCESCHGPNGRGGTKGSSITGDSFLALISNQALRTVVITGRPELGAPDWRGNVPGKPMSEQDVTDVVAWLAAQRLQDPGQPYSVSHSAQH
jgi:cytochrome c oxidase cbb3-type subunit III